MKNFLSKAKVQMKLAAHSVAETTGHSKIQEDPEVESVWERISTTDTNLDGLVTNIQKMKRTYMEFATYQHAACGNIGLLFPTDAPNYQTVSTVHANSEAVFTHAKGFYDVLCKDQIESRALKIREQLHKVKSSYDERKKYYILLDDAKKGVQKAQQKNDDKKLQKKQKKVDEYSAQYQALNTQFMNEAKAFLESSPAQINELFEAYQFYMCELAYEASQALITKPGYNWEASKGKFPSVTVAPQPPAAK